MAVKKNVWLAALAEVVRTHPKLSAAIAFELGVFAASTFKSVRLRKGLNGATAKLIEAVPMMSSTPPARRRKTKRKPAARKRKAVKRTKVVAQS